MVGDSLQAGKAVVVVGSGVVVVVVVLAVVVVVVVVGVVDGVKTSGGGRIIEGELQTAFGAGVEVGRGSGF